ncbi:hypothetical protein TNCV_4414391 [Trichonephila clavipes]|uniref:Uncharacterized protein n=1 Tax=Trichonephila clavipes TaxID=2585209 RepID=A0A8X6S231_TRICX|nr:hypothetical protein TNCV_4414391 [Trichonephila clavipes]
MSFGPELMATLFQPNPRSEVDRILHELFHTTGIRLAPKLERIEGFCCTLIANAICWRITKFIAPKGLDARLSLGVAFRGYEAIRRVERHVKSVEVPNVPADVVEGLERGGLV